MAQGTLQTQIENIIGSSFDSKVYDDWLVAGSRTIVDILKPDDMRRHSTGNVVHATNGMDVVLHRIWKVLVGGQTAIQRDEGQVNQMYDRNSFYRAGSFTPSYIISAGTLKCYSRTGETPGVMIGIKYPTEIDSSSDTEIDGVPENLHYAVILYAAIQGKLKQMSDTSALLDSASTELVAAKTALASAGTAEDVELMNANMQRIESSIQQMQAQTAQYDLSAKQLQSEYHGIINLYLGSKESQ